VLHVSLIVGVLTAGASAAARYVAYDEVSGVLTSLAGLVSPDLKNGDTLLPARWPEWASRYDRQIRSRLEAGDQETIVNWLLFGTTFTKQPRVPLEELGTSSPTRRLTDAQI